MSDMTVLSMLSMFAVGVWIGRGRAALSHRLLFAVFGGYVCFYLAAGLARLAM